MAISTSGPFLLDQNAPFMCNVASAFLLPVVAHIPFLESKSSYVPMYVAQLKIEKELKERDDKYVELDTKFQRLHKRAKNRIQDIQKVTTSSFLYINLRIVVALLSKIYAWKSLTVCSRICASYNF